MVVKRFLLFAIPFVVLSSCHKENGLPVLFSCTRAPQSTVSTAHAFTPASTTAAYYEEKTSISHDGRFVAFEASSEEFVLNDPNVVSDAFVHDRQTGRTTRVSIAPDGTRANGSSYDVSISADGRFVVFNSWASNLVPGDTNNDLDIFVYDRQTETTTLISVIAYDGSKASRLSDSPSISADGRFVAFHSLVSNFEPVYRGIFVHDRQTGTTTLASSSGSSPSISADGRFVIFSSWASDLVPDDTNEVPDVFVHDRQTRTTTRVSVASDGTQANKNDYKDRGRSYNPSISADGRFVAFRSWASNLVAGDTNERDDIFVHDRQTRTTTRVSIASDGTQADDDSYLPSISADGRFVTFNSSATTLVPIGAGVAYNLFVHDRQNRTTFNVPVYGDGVNNYGYPLGASISADNRFLVSKRGIMTQEPTPSDVHPRGYLFVYDFQTGTASNILCL